MLSSENDMAVTCYLHSFTLGMLAFTCSSQETKAIFKQVALIRLWVRERRDIKRRRGVEVNKIRIC